MSMPACTCILCLCVACGPAYPDPVSPGDPPECGTEALGRITAAYTAALVTACGTSKSLDECSPAQKKPVEDKFAPQFDAWEKCGSSAAH